MLLEQLFPDFLALSWDEKVAFLRSYRESRARELERAPTKRRKAKAKAKTPTLSTQEKEIIKQLGLKVKDLALLKELMS